MLSEGQLAGDCLDAFSIRSAGCPMIVEPGIVPSKGTSSQIQWRRIKYAKEETALFSIKGGIHHIPQLFDCPLLFLSHDDII